LKNLLIDLNISLSHFIFLSTVSAMELSHRNLSGPAIVRVVRLAPEWAELGLCGALAQRAGDPIGAALHLSSRTVADDAFGPCRRLVGTLRSRRGWHRIEVELQLAGWSASATELTLRPRRSGRRPGWGRWYLIAGTALLDRIVAGADDPRSSPGPADHRRQPSMATIWSTTA
jgi:hypothetical protein